MSIIARHRRQLLTETYAITRLEQALEEIDFLTRPEVIANPDLERIAVEEFGFHIIARRPNIFERIAACRR